MLLGIGAGLGAFALQALMATFALTIGVQGGLTRSTVLWLFAAGSFLQIFALPAYAALSDRIGRRPVMIAGCIAAIVAVYPILLLIASGNVLGVLLGFLIAMPLVQAAMYGPLAAFTTEIFATGNRYTGASLGYQLSSTLGGGFAPLIAATLVAGTTAGNGLFRVALFAAAAALISAVTIAIAKESSKRNLVDRAAEHDPEHRDAEAGSHIRGGLGTTACQRPDSRCRTSGKDRRGEADHGEPPGNSANGAAIRGAPPRARRSGDAVPGRAAALRPADRPSRRGCQASFGGLAGLYVPDSPYRYRARVVAAVGGGLTLAVFLGAGHRVIRMGGRSGCRSVRRRCVIHLSGSGALPTTRDHVHHGVTRRHRDPR